LEEVNLLRNNIDVEVGAHLLHFGQKCRIRILMLYPSVDEVDDVSNIDRADGKVHPYVIDTIIFGRL
jgi:hypothetical protein